MHVSLDVETTGLGPFNRPPREDAAVEVGIAYRDAAGQLVTWSELMQPEKPELLELGYADKALEINHITREQIRAALPAAFVWGRLSAMLERARAVAPGEPLLISAWNVEFDEWFVKRHPAMQEWLTRAGVAFTCSMRRCARAQGAQRVSLAKACEAYGIARTEEGAHRASYDAVLALRVWERLTELGYP